jgi:lysophospholipase L1-like esterase
MRITSYRAPLLGWMALALAAACLPPPLVGADAAAATAASKWEEAIRAFEAVDRTNPPPKRAVLFVGSSSFRLWTNLARDFAGHPVINRGFGGSQLSDVNTFLDRIVIPYLPRLILLYAGDNDIAAGKTPEQVLADFQRFVRRVQAVLPETRIGFVSIKPCPAREKFLAEVRAANRLIEQQCASDARLTFIDIFTPSLQADGRPRSDIYLPDGLHPNERGYALWASAIRPVLTSQPARRSGRGQVGK